MGIEGVHLIDGKHLSSRVVSSPLVIELVGLPHRSGVKHVGTGNCVLFRYLMIHFGREVILGSDLLTRKGEDPRVPSPQQRAVRHRIKSIDKTEDSWIDRDLARGEFARPRSLGRHGIYLRHAQ